MTSDPSRSQTFYGRLFSWTVHDPGPDYGGYVNFAKDGVMVAGCMRNPEAGSMPDVWSVYLATDDAVSTVEATVSHGGGVLVDAMAVMELGTMAVVTDPGQATVGAWQPGEHQGFGVWGEPGTPGWFELHTRDFDETLLFYEDVFRWDVHLTSDTPEFRYATLGEGERQLAGVIDASGFLPEGVPAHWSTYFCVDDTDAALSEVVGLGGKVVLPGEDTPYGRLATAADPTGALFKLVADLA
jgi:predicted enzyme related to lactoylglutathione lyase